MDRTRFQKTRTRPTWEGIIFTELDFGDQRISISTVDPANQLKDYIEYIWFMKWGLKENERLPCIVTPNPCAKLVVLQQSGRTFPSRIVGGKNEADFVELSGAGASIGFDFKPGALFALFGKSMNKWPEGGIKMDDLAKGFPLCPEQMWTEEALTKWLEEVESFLINILMTPPANNYKKIAALVEGTLRGTFKSPEEMAQEVAMSIRSLQRIFREEVGVSPRDLLRIARFNRAIRQIGQNDFKAFADIALGSGFFDQPHMINEFQKLVATSPSKFRTYL